MPTPLLAQAMRLPFLTGSLVPVLVVAAWWWGQGPMPWGLLLLTLAGVGCLQSGANLINDFYDAVGSDPLNRHATIFSGGSRVIQDGRMSRRAVGTLAVGFFVAAGSLRRHGGGHGPALGPGRGRGRPGRRAGSTPPGPWP